MLLVLLIQIKQRHKLRNIFKDKTEFRVLKDGQNLPDLNKYLQNFDGNKNDTYDKAQVAALMIKSMSAFLKLKIKRARDAAEKTVTEANDLYLTDHLPFQVS